MNLARKIHCLDSAFCDDAVELLEESKFQSSLVIGKGGMEVDKVRTSTNTTLNKYHQDVIHVALNAAIVKWSEQIQADYPSIYHCLELPGITPGLDTYREELSVLRYADKQKYDWHTDAPTEPSKIGGFDASRRLISCVLYLNDDFVGGETEMLGRKYKPEKGKVLIFPSNWNYPHRARPVTEGTKYAVVTWYHPA